MASLVLEGGTFRPIFSCGVMDALLDENLMFPYVIGVSAGISDGVSYISGQKGRNLEIARKYRNDKRYVGFRNIPLQRSFFGLDFVFGEIPKKLEPFDWDTYLKYDGRVVVGVTNARTGQAEYMDGLKTDEDFTMLRASCAIPLVFQPVHIGREVYYDGGLADPIPVKKAIADGNEKHLIILTRHKGYVKTLGREHKWGAKILRKKYPEIERLMLNRHEAYNETVRFCEELERQGKAVVLRPDYPIESFEKDVRVLEETYRHGYAMAKERMEEIRLLLGKP